jgi:hypothetical protein
LLTIFGVQFDCGPSEDQRIRIGGADCAHTRVLLGDDGSHVICELPTSNGDESTLSACCGGRCVEFDEPLVSFAAPRIDRVTGCAVDGSACSHNSSRSLLTLHGSNFGISQPAVLVGSHSCAQPQRWSHDSVVAECDARNHGRAVLA